MSEKLNDLVEQNKEFLNRELPGMTVDQCKALSERLGELLDKQHDLLHVLVRDDDFSDFAFVDYRAYNSGFLAGLMFARGELLRFWLV